MTEAYRSGLDLTFTIRFYRPYEFIACCAGSGGSILNVDSSAGVVAMRLERINLCWYNRRSAD